MLEGRRHAPANLGRVLVIGLGVSGRAVASYCLGLLGGRVESLRVVAGAGEPTEETRLFAAGLIQGGAQVVLDSEEVEGSFDVCIASPGIPPHSAFFQAAQQASAEVISEVEFAWRESLSSSRWVAITGTNGKTTVTSLTAHVAAACGCKAQAVGNIGDTCIDAVAGGECEVYVAEVSSYQLALTRLFAPDVAVVLNVTPDHLKWHGTLEAYAEAKRNALARLPEQGGVAVLCADDDTVRTWLRELRANPGESEYVPVGTKEGIEHDMRQACGSANAAFLASGDGALVVAFRGVEHRLCAASDLRLQGRHNVANALAAASATIALGCDAEQLSAALASFAPLAHRIEPVGQVAGAQCFNDSKATNVDATLKALSAFRPRKPIVLLGGDDKGTSLDDLVRAVRSDCKAAVCFGAAGPRFARALEGLDIPVELADGMEPALDCALGLAQAGDIVLLSPACASFDEFNSFEHRGDVFRQLVAQRAQAGRSEPDDPPGDGC